MIGKHMTDAVGVIAYVASGMDTILKESVQKVLNP